MASILVKLNGKTYNVVKRADNIEKKPIGFEETTITIGEIEVPAFKSEILDLTLVAIKDEDGNIKMAIYDNDEFSLYSELTSNNLTIYLLELKELKGYKKETIDINGNETEAYKFKTGSNFAIVYGKNVETGDESFYVYDEEEKTFQRYNDEQIKEFEKTLKNYQYITYAFGGALVLVFICFIISLIAGAKKRKKLKERQLEKTLALSKEEIKEEDNSLDEKSKKKKSSKK